MPTTTVYLLSTERETLRQQPTSQIRQYKVLQIEKEGNLKTDKRIIYYNDKYNASYHAFIQLI